jgi:5'-methylthioadenosine phosphorylase
MREGYLGIIGGSGLYALGEIKKSLNIETEFGVAAIELIDIDGDEVYFLPRHGKGHTIAPHLINYRANISALKKCGVGYIVATSAVGSMKLDFRPSMFGICSQFIDFTKRRESTFFDDFKSGIRHTDMTEPYSKELNKVIEESFVQNNENYVKDLTMVITEGPRFETKAEIRAFSLLGGEIVGMTGYPEVALSREIDIQYSAIAVCTNYAAGISNNPLSHREVIEIMNNAFPRLKNVLKTVTKLFYNK